ncbi:MAG: TonB-dependent receptor [Desulfocapsaceae bacterium]|nr:TonB-dependent receptor [Desulfocapsaceae bacterium]
MKRHKLLCALVLLVLLQQPTVSGAQDSDLTGLSIEELMALKVTSVSKKVQNLSDSAAAIFVITNDDLRKSGVTNIPDALRMVPGINVARIDSNKWAVNSRSANSRFADKLLVMIDGRSVYTPTYSGVYWEVQDVMLEDVDRIEVIRGPGATLWGANAVNGVINIITKHAAETLGGLVSLGGGNQEQAFAGARYGASFGENSYGRFYAKGFARNDFQYLTGGDANDDWDMARGGFRIDSSLTTKDSLTLHGDIYSGNIDQQMSVPSSTWSLPGGFSSFIQDDTNVSGKNLVALWEHVLSSGSKFTLQAYYDRTDRNEAFVKEKRDSFDVELQHLVQVGERNDVVWGARYRSSRDDFSNADVSILTMDPDSRQDSLYSAFLQDEIMLARDRFWLTLGSKLEHNDYTGSEFQPSVRLRWAPQSNHKLWSSVSRAVRTPSRVEVDGTVLAMIMPYPDSFNPASPFYNPLNPVPVKIQMVGSDDLEAEKLTAYELGYRFLLSRDFSLDTVLFYNDYDKLRKFTAQGTAFTATGVVQTNLATNSSSAASKGLELALAWQTSDWLKLDFAYSYLDSNMELDRQVGEEPSHQASLRGFINLRDDLDLNIWLRYVGSASAVYLLSQNGWYAIDEYATCDLRLAWRPVAKIELSLVGQNLLDGGHVEFVQETFTLPTEVGRAVYGKLTYKF